MDVLEFAQEKGFTLRGLVRSSLVGPKGNAEFLAWLAYPADQKAELETMISAVLADELRCRIRQSKVQQSGDQGDVRKALTGLCIL
jgi:hypothetical protein